MKEKGRWNKKYILIACLFTAVLTASCVYGRESESKKLEIVFVSKTIDESGFWSAVSGGADMAAKEYEVDYTVLAPREEEDYEGQNTLIREAIKRKPDVIVLSPSDYKKTLKAAKEVREAGIRLVLIDSVLEEEVADAVIATDNVKAGKALGEYAFDNLGEGDKIGVISHVKGSSTAIEREQGVRKGLGSKEINIMQVAFCDSRYDQAYQVTKDMLVMHPDIHFLICLNEYSTVGAARVVKDMGLAKEVKVIGFDNSKEEIQMLESGVVSALMVQKPFDMGYLGVSTAVSLAGGKAAPDSTDSGSKLITSEEIYTTENQKLLFPFWSEQ